MGYVAQEGGLPEFLTVEQSLDLFCGLHSVKAMSEEKLDVNILYCDALKGLTSRYSEILRCCIPGKKEPCSGAGNALDDTAGDRSRSRGGDRDGDGDVCLQVDGLDVNSSSSISYQTGIRTGLDNDNDNDNDDLLQSDNASLSAPSSLPLPLTVHWGHLVGSSPTSILPSKYLSYPVHTLSGGNKKKLSVAISSINDPSFLAIDECTTGTLLSLQDLTLFTIH